MQVPGHLQSRGLGSLARSLATYCPVSHLLRSLDGEDKPLLLLGRHAVLCSDVCSVQQWRNDVQDERSACLETGVLSLSGERPACAGCEGWEGTVETGVCLYEEGLHASHLPLAGSSMHTYERQRFLIAAVRGVGTRTQVWRGAEFSSSSPRPAPEPQRAAESFEAKTTSGAHRQISC